MIVREAREGDKQAVNELRRQIKLVHAAGRPDFFSADFNEESAAYLDILLRQENVEVLVAEQDSSIVGLACIEYIDRPATPYRVSFSYCHIMEFGVDERYRRQGIGTALFDAIKARAAERGFRRIDLGMWEFNEDALKFYEAMGFHTYKRQMEYP